MTRSDIEREAREFFDERDCPHGNLAGVQAAILLGVKLPRNDPAHCIECLIDFSLSIAAKQREEDAKTIRDLEGGEIECFRRLWIFVLALAVVSLVIFIGLLLDKRLTLW